MANQTFLFLTFSAISSRFRLFWAFWAFWAAKRVDFTLRKCLQIENSQRAIHAVKCHCPRLSYALSLVMKKYFIKDCLVLSSFTQTHAFSFSSLLFLDFNVIDCNCGFTSKWPCFFFFKRTISNFTFPVADQNTLFPFHSRWRLSKLALFMQQSI